MSEVKVNALIGTSTVGPKLPLNLALPNYKDLVVDPPGITDPSKFIDNYLQLVQLHANTARRDGDEAVAVILEGIVKRNPASVSEGGLTMQDAYRAARILCRPVPIHDEKGDLTHASVGLELEPSLDMEYIRKTFGGVLDASNANIASAIDRARTASFDIESDRPCRWDEMNPYPYDHRGAYLHTHKGRKPKRGLGAKRVKHVSLVKARAPLVWRLLSYNKKVRRIPSGWVVRHSINKKGHVVRDIVVDYNIAYNFRKRTGYYRGGN